MLVAFCGHDLLVSRQREERKILPVHVVAQIKDSWKTGAGEIRLIPRAIFLLGPQQVCDSSGDALAARVVSRKQPDDGPRSEEHTSELQSRFDLVCRLL